MSGVYIKGMDMPRACVWREDGHLRTCPLYDIDGYCRAIHSEACHKEEEHHPDCPAFFVPDHGRLIDADALADRLEKDRTFILHAMMEAHKQAEGYTREDYLFDRNGDMISMLRNQAAIIPADKEGEA